jgi:hypothetical protein
MTQKTLISLPTNIHIYITVQSTNVQQVILLKSTVNITKLDHIPGCGNRFSKLHTPNDLKVKHKSKSWNHKTSRRAHSNILTILSRQSFLKQERKVLRLGVVVHTCNPSTQEAEAEGSDTGSWDTQRRKIIQLQQNFKFLFIVTPLSLTVSQTERKYLYYINIKYWGILFCVISQLTILKDTLKNYLHSIVPYLFNKKICVYQCVSKRRAQKDI